MPNALKAEFSVTAGLYPGHQFTELTRVWHYTSADFEADQNRPEGEPSIFERYRQEAGDYALLLQDPASVNVVEHRFMWL